MVGRSRKKVVNNLNKKVEGNTLPSFDVKIDEKRILKNKPLYKLIFFSFILVFICVLILIGFRLINLNISQMVWKTNLTRGSDRINNKSVKYEYYLNGLMRISNDGITYINDKGDICWSVSYNVKEPIYISKNENFLVADKNGSSIYLFNQTGMQNSFNTSSILDIAMDDSGLILVLTYSNEYGYLLEYFNKDGKMYSKGIDYKPVDFDIAKNGTLFMNILTKIEDNKMIFYSEYKNVTNNLYDTIKIFSNEFIDRFLVRAHFFDDNYSLLLSDSNVLFVDNNNSNDIKILKNINFDKKIKSISYNDKYFVLIDEENLIKILNKMGTLMSEVKLDINYDKFYISDDYIIFIKDKRVVIYDLRGIIKFDKTLKSSPVYVAKKRSPLFTELLIGLIDGVQCFRFY